MIQEEKTLVIIKNEAVRRRLVGKIIQVFENSGLKIVSIKTVSPSEFDAKAHYEYGANEEWLRGLGEKVYSLYNHNAHRINSYFGVSEPTEIGKVIYQWSVKHLAGKLVVPIILQGPNAIEKVKKIVGSTVPSESDLSTIRGLYSSDSLEKSNAQRRAVYNIVHRSTNRKETKREISLWFPERIK